MISINYSSANDVVLSDTTTLNITICDGDIYEVNGTTFTEAGFYIVHIPNDNGNWDVVLLTLEYMSPIETWISEAICEDEIYIIGNQSYESPGNYSTILPSYMGCDSTIYLELSTNETSNTEQILIICEGEQYQLGNDIFDESGTYETVFTNYLGCDSVITSHIEILPNISYTHQLSVPFGNVYANEIIEQDTFIIQNFEAANGCDSIVYTVITVDNILKNEHINDITSLNIYPNPTFNTLNLSGTLAKNTQTIIELYDVFGQSIRLYKEQSVLSGNFQQSFDVSNLTNGTYLLKFQTDKNLLTKTIIIAN